MGAFKNPVVLVKLLNMAKLNITKTEYKAVYLTTHTNDIAHTKETKLDQ